MGAPKTSICRQQYPQISRLQNQLFAANEVKKLISRLQNQLFAANEVKKFLGNAQPQTRSGFR